MYFINRDHPPVAFVAQVGYHSDAEQKEHLQELMRLAREDLDRGQRWVLVVDARFTPAASAHQRRQLWNVLNDNADLVRASTVAHIFIIDSSLMRGAVTALRWMGAVPREMQVVGSFARALDFAASELRDAALGSMPATLRGPDAEQAALGPALAFARTAGRTITNLQR